MKKISGYPHKENVFIQNILEQKSALSVLSASSKGEKHSKIQTKFHLNSTLIGHL